MTWNNTTGRLAAAALAVGLGVGCASEDAHRTSKEMAARRQASAPPGTSVESRQSEAQEMETARRRSDQDQQDQLIRDRQAGGELDHPALARFARTLPAFSLADPRGQRLDRDGLLGPHGAVFIVTAPTLAEGDEQEAWNDALTRAAPGGASWVLVEDLSQSTFKGAARSHMKEDYDPNQRPYIVIDEEGRLREQLGVAEGETVILAYDAQGKLRHCETGDASPEGAARIWSLLQQGPMGQPVNELDREIEREMRRD